MLKYNNNYKEDMNLLLIFNWMIIKNHFKVTRHFYDFKNELPHHNCNVKEYYLNLGIIYMSLGYYIKICFDKKYRKFFFMLSGIFYYNNDPELFKKYNKLNEYEYYKQYLFSYNKLINILYNFEINNNKSKHLKCLNSTHSNYNFYNNYAQTYKNKINYIIQSYYCPCISCRSLYDIKQHILELQEDYYK